METTREYEDRTRARIHGEAADSPLLALEDDR